MVLLLIHGIRFLSTPSARRATAYARAGSTRNVISIHALCEEGDAQGIKTSKGAN